MPCANSSARSLRLSETGLRQGPALVAGSTVSDLLWQGAVKDGISSLFQVSPSILDLDRTVSDATQGESNPRLWD